MAKLMGTLRITANPASEGAVAHFEVVFVPYAGRHSTKPVIIKNLDDLKALLMELRMGEDEASRWVGKTRGQGVVLIAGLERTELQLKENGLLA